MIWPAELSSHYPYPQPFAISNPKVLASVIAAVLLIILLVVSLRWTKAALTGSLIFLITILPTMQIFKFSEVIASDKFAYLPSFGVLMMLAYFLLWLYNNNFRRALIISVVILLLAGAEGIATRRYLIYWKDTISLFNRMLTLAPDSASLYGHLAVAYSHIGQDEKAVELSERAITINPSYGQIYFNLGIAYYNLRRYQDAIDAFQKAIRLPSKNTDVADAYTALAEVYATLGRARHGRGFIQAGHNYQSFPKQGLL